QTHANIAHGAVFQNDAAFDFRIQDGDIVIDAGERADIAVFDDRVFADDGGAAHHTVADPRTAFDSDTPVNFRIFDGAIRRKRWFETFQHQAVGFQHIQRLA